MDEHTYTFKQPSEPVVDFMNMKPNSNITFHRDGTQIGVLDFNLPEMTFTGDADESAKVFFDFIAKSFKARLEQERADEREACAKVCDRVVERKDLDDIHSDSQWAALTLAAEIRSRRRHD